MHTSVYIYIPIDCAPGGSLPYDTDISFQTLLMRRAMSNIMNKTVHAGIDPIPSLYCWGNTVSEVRHCTTAKGSLVMTSKAVTVMSSGATKTIKNKKL